MPKTATPLTFNPASAPFEDGSALIIDGKPHLAMAFYGIFRRKLRGGDLPGHVLKETVTLPGFQMKIAGGLSMVDRTNTPTDKVVVDIIAVPVDMILKSIDCTESHPSWYVRTWLPDVCSGVWCYLMPEVRRRGDVWPSGDYVEWRELERAKQTAAYGKGSTGRW